MKVLETFSHERLRKGWTSDLDLWVMIDGHISRSEGMKIVPAHLSQND